MSKPIIFASMVDNLTDARYFAAREVSYLGYKIENRQDLINTAAFISWVEGPDSIADCIDVQIYSDCFDKDLFSFVRFPEIDNSGIFQSVSFLSIYNNNEACPSVVIIDKYLSEMDDVEKLKLKNRVSQNNSFLDMPFRLDEVTELLEKIQPYGILVRGGSEEKPGFKSYDELDEFFDFLDDLNVDI
jgi:phosphoribosylanthranilate isomerase